MKYNKLTEHVITLRDQMITLRDHVISLTDHMIIDHAAQQELQKSWKNSKLALNHSKPVSQLFCTWIA